MIILIDGYNLLRQIFHQVKVNSDVQREQLIKQLSFYKQKKKMDIEQIIIVFDGGFFRHAERFVKKGIVTVFSGKKQSADDWIINYVKKNKNKSEKLLVVTLDREIVSECAKFGVDSISGFDFYNIVQDVLIEEVEQDLIKSKKKHLTEKYEDENLINDFHNNKIRSEALDVLMEQEIFHDDIEKKDDNYINDNSRKGKAYKLSKKKRKLIKKVRKLY